MNLWAQVVPPKGHHALAFAGALVPCCAVQVPRPSLVGTVARLVTGSRAGLRALEAELCASFVSALHQAEGRGGGAGAGGGAGGLALP